MSRYSPNFGPSQPAARQPNALGSALVQLANAYLAKKMGAREEQRQDAMTTADLYARGFRPTQDAAAATPVDDGNLFPTYTPPSFDATGVPRGVQRPVDDLGFGHERIDVGTVDPTRVHAALATSDFFDRVDQRDATLRAAPGVDFRGQHLVYSPEAVAAERSAGSDRERASMLHAIDLMRASGELSGPELTRARLAANGITLPTSPTFDQLLALEAVRNRDRLDVVDAQGRNAVTTRQTPAAPARGSAPAQTPRDKFLNQRYTELLNEKDAYGTHVYTNAEAMAQAQKDTDLRYGTGTPAPADTSRAARLRGRF